MKWIHLTILSVFLISSCATTTPGDEHETGTQKLKVFVTINPDYSTDKIKLFQFSIKNNSDQWIDIDDIKLNNNSKEISLIVGNRLQSWLETSNLEKQVSDYNTSLVLSGVIFGGVAAMGSSNSKTSTAGAMVALGSITAVSIMDIQDTLNFIELQKMLPDNHLLRPFTIPPKRVLQRWIVLENHSKEPVSIQLKSKQDKEIDINLRFY
jgi:hypothetical protein